MSHCLSVNYADCNVQALSSWRFPIRAREVYSNYCPKCTSINLLKQWMILLGCDLQQAKSSEMLHPLGWNTSTNLPSTPFWNMWCHSKFPFKSFVLLGFFWFVRPPWDIFFFHYSTCPYHANQSALQKYHCHRWVCFNRSWGRFPDLLICQSQQPFGQCCVGLCTQTTCSCHFRMTSGILDNYHALM